MENSTNAAVAIDRVRTQSWRECVEKYRLDPSCQLTYKVPPTLAGLGELLINAPPQPIADFADQVMANLGTLSRVPTALLCTSDELAIALRGCLTQKGWKLPQDLSIVGFYNIDVGEYVFPRLTTIAQPLEKISSLALDRLQTLMAPQETPATTEVCRHLLAPQLIVRESTAPPRTHDAPLL